jgi:hypothetical protein
MPLGIKQKAFRGFFRFHLHPQLACSNLTLVDPLAYFDSNGDFLGTQMLRANRRHASATVHVADNEIKKKFN